MRFASWVTRDLIECVTDPTTQEAIEAVWRLESTRLIAGLVRIVRDVGLAEDLAQDALVAALTQWPRTGVPDNPGAWLMTIAKRRAVDQFRRRDRRDQLIRRISLMGKEATCLTRTSSPRSTTWKTTCCG